MKAICKNMQFIPGVANIVQGVKKDDKDGPLGDNGYFRNLRYGKGLISYPAELLLRIEIDGLYYWIPVGKAFREKFQKPGKAYATLTKERINRIIATMPEIINVMETGDARNPYVADQADIEKWFLSINYPLL